MDSDDDIPIASLGAKLHKPATPPKPPAPIPKISKPPQTASVATVSSSSILTASELARKKKLKAMKKFLKNQAAGGKRSRDDDDDDFEKSKKKASSSKPKGPPKPPAPPKKLKEQDKAERINQAMKAHLWWEAEPLPAGQQWRSMEHCGVAFPEEYEAHGVKMLYDGKEITLTKEGEEAANFFAAMDPNGMHLKNDATAKIFIKNFFDDWKEMIGPKSIIKKFELCDFKPITEHLENQKMVRKAITDNERKANKEVKDEVNYKHGYAMVDGHLEKVGNYNMEPPGTFRGRGEHPKMGKIKSRVMPEQTFINMSEECPPPKCPMPGHAWGDVRHDPSVQWLSNWKENINGQDKYVQLAAMSSFKGISDRSKYNKAARLCGNIASIRKDYKKNLKNKDVSLREIATAMWVIDRLALRVGGEKDTSEEADTVGCCSLRVEHMQFNPDGDNPNAVNLEFLGKDSMLFKQTVDFGADMYTENDGMGLQVLKNFQDFVKKKAPKDEIFTTLTPTILNNHLSHLMPGLSAKVFRTYNASKTLQDELAKKEELASWAGLSVQDRVDEYNNANRIVAILCNHQKSVSAAAQTGLDLSKEKVEKLKEQKKILKMILKILSAGADKIKIPLKQSEEEMKAEGEKEIAAAKAMKEAAVTDEEKISATKADEVARQKRRDNADSKFNQGHLWEKVPNEQQVIGKITLWTEKISKAEHALMEKDSNKEVSLGTSKINYMDPRVTVAFCKRNEVPIEKLFSKTLRDKFNWACSVPMDWEFCAKVGNEE